MTKTYIEIDFIPFESGRHFVHITSADNLIENTPFAVEIIQEQIANPDMVKIEPISEGKVGDWNSFLVSTKNAGYGILSTSIKGPSSCEIIIEPYEESSCFIKFRTNQSGDYQISVKFGNRSVPGCPFTVTLPDEVFYEASYLQTPRFRVGKCCEYSLHIPDSSVDDFVVTVMDSANEEQDCFVKETSSNDYIVTFTPQRHGEHRVNILKKGEPLSGSPFLFTVGAIGYTGTEIKLSGNGLSKGVINYPNKFNVYTHGLDDGNFSVSVCGPSKAIVNIDKEYNDDCFTVSYTIPLAGTYKIFVYHNNEPTHDSPYIVPITGIDMINKMLENISMEGSGLSRAIIGADNNFVVKIDGQEEGRLLVTIDGPSPVVIKYDETRNELNSQYKFIYNVEANGEYLISVKFTENMDQEETAIHLKGSPFIVSTVDDGLARVSECMHRTHCSTTVIKKSSVDRKTGKSELIEILGLSSRKECGVQHSLSVNTSKAGHGMLMLGLMSEDRKMFEFNVCQDKENIFNVMYCVDKPGMYWMAITWAGEQLPDSPFMIEFY